MSEVTETASFVVPAPRLWELVSDFGGLADIMEGVDECATEGDGVGMTRTVGAGDRAVVESLDVLDDDAMTLTYSIVSGPLPFEDYSATMTVTADGAEASNLTWTGTFEPKGVPQDKAERLASNIYKSGIAGYQACV